MNDPQIAKIIEILEHMGERPALYACTKTTKDVGIFLSGFECGCHASRLDLNVP